MGERKISIKVSDFLMGKYPVTQALWQSVMAITLSESKGINNPVKQVSWDDTQAFIEKLNKVTGQNYRLPSEVEWEYAARGGKKSLGFRFSGSNKLKEVGWYKNNSHNQAKPVVLKLPNELGIYDMSGNVWEWCADHWHDNLKNIPAHSGAWIGDANEVRRVVRGGSWDLNDFSCQVSFRFRDDADLRDDFTGFRLARD